MIHDVRHQSGKMFFVLRITILKDDSIFFPKKAIPCIVCLHSFCNWNLPSQFAHVSCVWVIVGF